MKLRLLLFANYVVHIVGTQNVWTSYLIIHINWHFNKLEDSKELHKLHDYDIMIMTNYTKWG